MHMFCDHECPSDCPNKLWRYWNGTTRGHGNWIRDEHFKVLDGILNALPFLINNTI